MTEELEEIKRRKMGELLNLKSQPSVNQVSGVLQKAIELADAILNSAQYLMFDEARRRVEYDAEAQGLIQEFQQKQQSLLWLQQMGTLEISQVQELKNVQGKLLHHPTIGAYFRSQRQLTELVQTVNDTISKKTGLNFTSTGSCCG